ncbi:hypothetical protein MWU54_04670 [Marivita sp. S6314]|uniref:hypothetical protein n=1 Tax=Marivita sp. S6314 TaxID=2926406 RepID=UPI001FF3D044|nr:hypothetical protein [Marivita sp. S6314]MCK0149305.1 hypothetical protein [Marivita sp. S6314]
MNFKTKAIRLIGTPVVFSLISTPLLAATQTHLDAPRQTAPATTLELLYPQYAQVGGDDIGGGGGGGDDGNFANTGATSGPAVAASSARTSQVVRQIEQIQRICEFMGDEYRVSCFATTYRELAKDIPNNGDYKEARDALLDAAKKLDRLTRQNIDRQKPSLRARLTTDSGQAVSTPPIAAVRAPAAPQINRQAANILEEAETVLLRSASSDAARAIHYQRIAAAVGSNKVLLRSG